MWFGCMGDEKNMKTINWFVTAAVIFFLVSGALVTIFSDIGTKNLNLNSESVAVILELETYEALQEQYTITDNAEINYSLAGYEDIAPEDKENAESKGFLLQFLALKDSVTIAPVLFGVLIPWFPMQYLSWAIGLVLAGIGLSFGLASYLFWKGRAT